MAEVKKKAKNYSRAKGIRFERALANILSEKLGKVITRNWQAQSAVGGHDLEGLENFAIECKACAKITIKQWWEQTIEQAEKTGRIPVLCFKPSQKDWVVVIDLELIDNNYKNSKHLVSISIDCFVEIIKDKGLV